MSAAPIFLIPEVLLRNGVPDSMFWRLDHPNGGHRQLRFQMEPGVNIVRDPTTSAAQIPPDQGLSTLWDMGRLDLARLKWFEEGKLSNPTAAPTGFQLESDGAISVTFRQQDWATHAAVTEQGRELSPSALMRRLVQFPRILAPSLGVNFNLRNPDGHLFMGLRRVDAHGFGGTVSTLGSRAIMTKLGEVPEPGEMFGPERTIAGILRESLGMTLSDLVPNQAGSIATPVALMSQSDGVPAVIFDVVTSLPLEEINDRMLGLPDPPKFAEIRAYGFAPDLKEIIELLRIPELAGWAVQAIRASVLGVYGQLGLDRLAETNSLRTVSLSEGIQIAEALEGKGTDPPLMQLPV